MSRLPVQVIPRSLVWIGSVVLQSVLAKPGHTPAESLLLSSPYFIHAVASPLTDLTLNLELMLQEPNLTRTKIKDYSSQALLNAKYLNNLFRLLKPHHQPQTFPVKKALQEVLMRTNRPQDHQYVSGKLQIPSNAVASGNVFYFEEALACIINNAFEAYQRRPRHVFIFSYVVSSSLVIYIGDVAKGMSQLTQRLVFIPGVSLKKGNQGLGLSLAKNVIEKHLKGELAAASFSGVGTVFMIRLPLKR